MARKGVENSEIRASLITAARQLIQTEGFHAVTARRLSEQVGLKRQIVHYYFGTLDDLFIAVLREDGEIVTARMINALETEQPLKLVWEQAYNASAAGLEMMALALHRKGIRDEIKRIADDYRDLQIAALTDYLDRHKLSPSTPPAVSALMMASVAQGLALEKALGMSKGHEETIAHIEALLKNFENSGRSF